MGKGEVTNMVISNEGFYLAIASKNGDMKTINTRYMTVDRDEPCMDGEISTINFTDDFRFIMTAQKGTGKYLFTSNLRAPGMMRTFF